MGFLRRTALLFEIYCADKYKCAFDIALSWYDKKRLLEFFRKGGEDAIKAALDGIDFEKSKCGFKAMRDKILAAVPADASARIKQFLINHMTQISGIPKNMFCCRGSIVVS